VNRALEQPHVRDVSVWGCGNFELNWPARLFANHAALRDGRLRVFPWAERYSRRVGRRFAAVSRADWRDRFQSFCEELRGAALYITVDLDCLAVGTAVTNWEQGLFTPDDITWALGRLRQRANIIGGDVCGAHSPPRYARRVQKFVAEWDRPKLPPPDPDVARRLNVAALQTIWPALTA
jgi:hypothetical protein